MAPHLTDLSLLDHDNPVRIPHGREPVGYDECGAPVEQCLQRLLDEPLGFAVERGGGLVENQNGRVLEQRPGNGDPLPLAAGKSSAPFPDDGVIAIRQIQDEVMGMRRSGRRLDLGMSGVAVGHRRCWPGRCR